MQPIFEGPFQVVSSEMPNFPNYVIKDRFNVEMKVHVNNLKKFNTDKDDPSSVELGMFKKRGRPKKDV